MEKRMANKVSVITIIINLVLSVFKFLVGIFGNSQALVSDAIHSASDVVSTVAVMFGINLSAKKSDSLHQYGHERIECIFSIILSHILVFYILLLQKYLPNSRRDYCLFLPHNHVLAGTVQSQ